MRELRTLIVTPDFPPAVGGIQTVVHRVAHHAESLSPYVTTLWHEDAPAFDATLDFPVHRVAPLRAGYRATIGRLNLAALVQALRFRPDVVLSGHIVTAPVAALIHRTLGTPVAQYLYGYELTTRPSLTSFSVRNAQVSIAVSSYTRDLAVAAGAAPDSVAVVPPGADPPQRTDRPRDREPTILTVARLHQRYKGHDVILRALPLVSARVPEVRWIVIGDGPLRDDIARLAATYGVSERVKLLGAVADRERDEWFARSHVFAMPSRIPAESAGEGFGIVYLEANLHGLPVLAGAVGGAIDAVVDGETGLLVDPTDHVAVADALVSLLEDPQRAAALGAAGAVRARRDFNWPVIAHDVERVLMSIARR